MDTAQSLAFRKMLSEAAKKKSTDLHMSVGVQPQIRVNGMLETLSDSDVSTEQTLTSLLDAFLSDAQKGRLVRDRELVYTTVFDSMVRCRVHFFYQEGYVAFHARFLSLQVPLPKELDVPSAVEQFSERRQGLLLIAGNRGAGKTTLAASLLEQINRTRQAHILTLESPIEYNLTSNKSIVEQREIGVDTLSFEAALEASVRDDVDVLFVSEIQSGSVMRKLMEYASSGMFVIAIIPGDSSVMILEKVVSFFQSHEQEYAHELLSSVLEGLVIRTLVPRIGGGLIGVHEVLLNTASVKTLIGSGRLQQIEQMITSSRSEGMMSHDHQLASLVREQQVTLEAARAYPKDKQMFETLVRGL